MDDNNAPDCKTRQLFQTWTFFEGDWHEGNVPIMGPRTHAAWLASTVFDGARAFEGVAPDLDRHCARVNQSAINFKLKPVVDTATWMELAREGIARFDARAELYIRPMYWAQNGSGGGVLFDPETTNWCLSIYVAPMPRHRARRSRCRHSAGRRWKALRWIARPLAFTPTIRGR